MKDSVYKNRGGKYTSAPARAVAFFASQKTMRQIPLLAWSSDFCFAKTRRYICRLILGGLAL